ncbi:right-handed parallel beta-helix repeat-containing protein [Corallococcus praedator]|uniref:Right-handed parallel beta-helix repeat-containing protein n=1 Tax=Corallococcus praedator TaxID=2316724 RepID=A0ABX9QST9_9BACT|nr:MULTISPECIES: right-handed parallel beta-helix repeat-containing protein [Corallococcus]RKH34857.1 right-handed parallel beta-helix repeat-containing protein [Corallococcus sp. CA031C]RKI16739.1 right-handed parallel beta-helix repeat-containing protein [Corallococcus praedator]
MRWGKPVGLASSLSPLLILACVCLASPAHARDWFVRAGSTSGDGSREKPFADPWMALERVEANDKVHVAAGRYFGKLEKGNWVLSFPGVELLGGYDANFRERNPWKSLTELTWRKGAANRPDISLARVSTSAERDTAGATIDGFLIDMQDYYEYAGEGGNFNPMALLRNGAVDLAKGGILRNCMIVNSINAVRTSPGAVVENNVIVNSLFAAVSAKGGGDHDLPVTLRDNTIAFVWATKAIAEGGTEGAGIDVTNKALVENNLLVHSDNHGAQIIVPAKVTFQNNAFWRNLYSNVTFYFQGKKSSLDDSDIAEAEDAGFARAGGNIAVDPKLPFDNAWYEKFTRRATLGKKFDAKAWEETRTAAGFPATGEQVELFAPAYPPQAVAALIAPKNPALKQGARVKTLPVSFSAVAATTVSKTYAKAGLDSLAANPKGYDGKDLQLIVGVQGVANPDNGPPGTSRETHKAVFLIDAKNESRVTGFFKKGTALERAIDAIPNYGSGPPRDLFVVRGTAHFRAGGYPKHALVIDAIEPYEKEVVASERPKGRDWFVRAGESGGDGSREKPFRDPFQAIEQAGRGDRILVATGEYGGKLKSGKWMVDGKQYLALLGGWDRDFNKRDPWNTPSLFSWPSDSKTAPQGYLFEGNGDHTGLIVDGFVFDRRTLNRYDKDGFIDLNTSPDNEHLWVSSPESVIRNCTFVNGAGAAVRMSNGVTFENNLVVNVFNEGVRVTGGFGTRPAQIRDNTFLFVWNRNRPHQGSSSTGSGLAVTGNAPAVVDGNVFQYIDNFGVKSESQLNELVLTNNAFFRNWAAFRSTLGTPPPTVDEKSMHLLADLPFKKAEGNVVVDGGFDIDPAFYASWFARTSQLTGLFTPEEWNQIAPKPTGGEAAKPGVGRALDWKQAAKLFPRNAQVKGARLKKLESGSDR